jgi:glycosyltransferase involved in cell wall biosynthesis
MQISMDVVIPTVRLDPLFLCALLDLPTPEGLTLRYYVVIDQPATRIPAALASVFARDGVTLLINGGNHGAAESRNRGFAAGNGQFVLFLDDDVIPEPGILGEYVTAISADVQESPGYIGVTRFPPPVNSFTSGVWMSDMLTFFDMAAHRPSLEWGVTANLCVRRAYVSGTPFRSVFPKGGGGEDIDLCLRMRAKAGRAFRAVPTAVVHHPWWNNGARSYSRFFRWAYGDSQLPALHPRLRYLDFPTLPELWLVILLLMPLLKWEQAAVSAAILLLGSTVIDFAVDYIAFSLSREWRSPVSSAEATVIRLSNDLGRLVAHVRHLRIRGLLERFEYFGTGESIGYERSISASKFLCWSILAWVLVA